MTAVTPFGSLIFVMPEKVSSAHASMGRMAKNDKKARKMTIILYPGIALSLPYDRARSEWLFIKGLDTVREFWYDLANKYLAYNEL